VTLPTSLPTVNAKDPLTGKRKPVFRTIRAPNTRRGRQQSETELAKLETEVEARQPDATLARIRRHITPKLGTVALDRRRPIDIDDLYASWRTAGMAEATVRRMHAILHAALTQAVRWDLIISNPADRIEAPKPAKSRRKAPPDELLQAILGAAGDDMICYLRLAAVTGARRGQMAWPSTPRRSTSCGHIAGGPSNARSSPAAALATTRSCSPELTPRTVRSRGTRTEPTSASTGSGRRCLVRRR
jgi:hypothetical protein